MFFFGSLNISSVWLNTLTLGYRSILFLVIMSHHIHILSPPIHFDVIVSFKLKIYFLRCFIWPPKMSNAIHWKTFQTFGFHRKSPPKNNGKRQRIKLTANAYQYRIWFGWLFFFCPVFFALLFDGSCDAHAIKIRKHQQCQRNKKLLYKMRRLMG